MPGTPSDKRPPLTSGQYLLHRIADLEGAVASLLDQKAAQAVRLAELEKENAELKAKVDENEGAETQ